MDDFGAYNHDFDDSLSLCAMCERVCLEMGSYCLKLGGKYSERKVVLLLQNTADICAVYAKLSISGSPVRKHLAKVGAEICNLLHEQCVVIGGELEACGEVSKTCAEFFKNEETDIKGN